ncbi:thioredoxin-like protein [Astrocystis sublimbata]|nr:thioredoxin-like protein [Astrocystis sublimbata]
MFRFRKTLDTVTLFHKASSPASVRAATVLKQASANAAETATEDQASDHSHQTSPHRSEFELDITENPPTGDQLQTILEYVDQAKISSIVNGATNLKDALKKYKESPDSFKYPVIVDWNNGKALASDNQSEILRMLRQVKE